MSVCARSSSACRKAYKAAGCHTDEGGDLQVGDKIPDAIVYGSSPGDKIKVRELFAGKKAVIFGVPGAPRA